jgi:hypothetical protein
VDFSKARNLFVIIFQIPGSNYKFFDYGLILEKLRGLNAKCPKLDFLGIVFLKETRGPSPRVRGPRAPAKGRERGSGAQGVRWVAHWGTSGGVAAGRRGGAVAVGKIRW